MKALVYKISGKQNENDPVNIHVLVFWTTILFWAVAGPCIFIAKALA